ncbi:aminotransferase class V-fold PLP-dependent enzyme [Sesbania bispinosa]|nr:aminotransferase class V-fold PLP-dependent enzyme [Sesbania bispinosa]
MKKRDQKQNLRAEKGEAVASSHGHRGQEKGNATSEREVGICGHGIEVEDGDGAATSGGFEAITVADLGFSGGGLRRWLWRSRNQVMEVEEQDTHPLLERITPQQREGEEVRFITKERRSLVLL